MSSKRDYKLFLNDIKVCIEKIENKLKIFSKEDFMSSEEFQDFIIRKLEIIGEASRNIPKSLKVKNSSIPWQKLELLRDAITHSYYQINLERVWVEANNIHSLKKQFNNIKLV